MAWKQYTVRINNQSNLGTILPDDVMEGIWDGNGLQGNYPDLDNKNYLNVEVNETGSVIYSANATIGTPTKDTVFTLLRVNGDLTINTGVTVTTPARKLGLAILVKGNCTINGTLDMTARGANHNGSSIAETLNPNSADSGFLNTYPGRIIRLFSGSLNLISLSGTTATPTGSSNNISLPDQGTAGGQNVSAQGIDASASSLATGGGGAGQGTAPGLGAAGSTFSGGTGGGGSGITAGRNGTPNGGRGGLGSSNTSNTTTSGGGAGNPGGAGGYGATGNRSDIAGLSGTGGVLILFVTGNVPNTTGTLTIGSSGKILSRGSSVIDSQNDGGGSGGGVICIAAKNYALTTNYEISAAGGSGLSAGRGGNGSVNLYQIAG